MVGFPLTEVQNSVLAVGSLVLSVLFLATLLPQWLQAHPYVRLGLAKVYFSAVGSILMFAWPCRDVTNILAWPVLFALAASFVEAGFWGHAIAGFGVRLVRRSPLETRRVALIGYSVAVFAVLFGTFVVGSYLTVEVIDRVDVATGFVQTDKVAFVRYFVGTSTLASLFTAAGSVIWVPWVASRTSQAWAA